MEHSFAELMARVKQGEQDAADTLVRLYEPQIRRMVRQRLTSPALRQQMDSMDVCQEVMGDFFEGAADEQYTLDSPAQMIALLAAMVRNQVVHHLRRQRAARRDIRRTAGVDVGELALAGNDATPSRIISSRELLTTCRAQLSDDERYLFDQRSEGRSWPELAEELGEQADTLRRRLDRALVRVSANLRLDESGMQSG